MVYKSEYKIPKKSNQKMTIKIIHFLPHHKSPPFIKILI